MENRYIVIILIILLLFLFYPTPLSHKREYMDDNVKISIIIPFIKRDTAYLHRCLKEQKQQTLIPHEIIIAGELPNIDIKNQLIKNYNDLNIKFVSSGGRTPAGINRNLGAGHATGDVYLFTDVDDIYHPRRNEIMAYVFDKYNPLFVGYHYTMKNKLFNNINKLSDLKYKYMDNIYKHTFSKDKKYPYAICCSSGYIHNGHIAVHKDIFEKYNHKYKAMNRGQDSEFNSSLLKRLKTTGIDEKRFMVIVEYLSFYIPNKDQ